MKKFTFSLEKMLNYKTTLLEEEKATLGRMRAELNAIEAEIQQTTRQMLNTDIQLKKTAAQGVNVMQLRNMSFQIDNTRNLIADLKKQQVAQEKKVQMQLQVVLGATQEVSGMEKLKEKQLEAYRYSLQKEEELMISELVSTQYVRAGHSR
ncbi:MAG: flagellar FliJ family protein [Oscillospiraceae bacterium]|nr:flagellar FliJ family protein [Oscillospiraceae bacterium]